MHVFIYEHYFCTFPFFLTFIAELKESAVLFAEPFGPGGKKLQREKKTNENREEEDQKTRVEESEEKQKSGNEHS